MSDTKEMCSNGHCFVPIGTPHFKTTHVDHKSPKGIRLTRTQVQSCICQRCGITTEGHTSRVYKYFSEG